MMAVARNVADASQSIKAGKWERSRLTGIEAKGKTLAIVGLGKGKPYNVNTTDGSTADRIQSVSRLPELRMASVCVSSHMTLMRTRT